MGYKNIMINKASKINIKNNQLIIDDEHSIPSEDINCLLIESRNINLNSFLLSHLGSMGVCILFCDDKHLPCSILLPYNNYYRKLNLLNTQLNISKPKQKQIWKDIIVQKIINQTLCLKYAGKNEYNKVMNISKKVKPGDISNMEAVAANKYFPMLFGKGFTRGQENIINAGLNYGYAIIRALIARTLCLYGFECALGIFHKNEYNNFNLADDLLECYRPFVDLYIHENILKKEGDDLTTEVKKQIFTMLSCSINCNNEKHSISNSIELLVQSYKRAIENKEVKIMLPELIKLETHIYE